MPTTTLPPAPPLPGDPFTLGVASGDPLPDSVILWTRLAPEPLAPGGAGGMPAEQLEVVWEVSETDTFDELSAGGTAAATPLHAHCVHVDVTGLSPSTTYWYRFRVGPHTSPTGRTRTMPATTGPPGQIVLGHASCQNFETGMYAAHRDISTAGLDALVWLGDYIYEGEPGRR